ncbi:MAG: chromosomal replication initiator protein DnaA [Acholeplasmatales bacterium]|jgi:chromosomal replication initiator protein|nr:chromosomal replication initiator protein DnaA [Acholeplasmatales bacterium]
MQNINDLWNKILSNLKEYTNEEVFEEVFGNIKDIYSVKDNIVKVIVENAFSKNRIERLYINKINELASGFAKEEIEFKFITREEALKEKQTNDSNPTNINKFIDTNLNKTYTFNNFIVGEPNFFASRMALKVAEQLGCDNPLYIFGDVGLGKTHLMQAVGNYVADKNEVKKEKLNILYVKSDVFREDFTKSLGSKNMEDFYKKYRNCDLLLVDDIQILSGSKQTQSEFFKLFDFLYNNNKQIVITSDKPATELKDIMPRLTSRFSQGLSVDIGTPDKEMRKKILRKKLELEYPSEVTLNDDILEYIARLFDSNIRELEGALKRVIYYSMINNHSFTLENAKESLESLVKSKKKINNLTQSNYYKIQSIVSDYFGITIEELISKQRSAKYILPRHISMYLIKKNNDVSFKQIGEMFGGKDHSTVLSAYEKIEKDIKNNDQTKKIVEMLTKKINI